MRARKNWLLIGAVIMTLAAAAAWSQGPSDDPAGQPRWQRGSQMREMMATPPDLQQELGLSEEQAGQLRSLRFEAAKSGLQARTDVKLKHLELQQLLQSDEPNQAAIDKALRGLSDAQYALMKNGVQHQLAMRQVLTAEQRKKWEGMKRQFMRHRMHRMGGQRFFERRGPRGPRGGGFGMPGFGPGPGPMSFAPAEEGLGPEFESDFGPEFEPDFGPNFELPVEPPQEPGS